jgi:flagellar protein FliO/FliZ
VKARLAWLASAVLFSLRAAADPASPPASIIYPGTPPSAPAGHPEGAGYSVTAAIFIVGCASAGVWLWLRSRKGAAGGSIRGERKLSIAETKPLGNRQYLIVAAYEGRKYLLGVCPGRIDLLTRLDQSAPPSP